LITLRAAILVISVSAIAALLPAFSAHAQYGSGAGYLYPSGENPFAPMRSDPQDNPFVKIWNVVNPWAASRIAGEKIGRGYSAGVYGWHNAKVAGEISGIAQSKRIQEQLADLAADPANTAISVPRSVQRAQMIAEAPEIAKAELDIADGYLGAMLLYANTAGVARVATCAGGAAITACARRAAVSGESAVAANAGRAVGEGLCRGSPTTVLAAEQAKETAEGVAINLSAYSRDPAVYVMWSRSTPLTRNGVGVGGYNTTSHLGLMVPEGAAVEGSCTFKTYDWALGSSAKQGTCDGFARGKMAIRIPLKSWDDVGAVVKAADSLSGRNQLTCVTGVQKALAAGNVSTRWALAPSTYVDRLLRAGNGAEVLIAPGYSVGREISYGALQEFGLISVLGGVVLVADAVYPYVAL